MKLDGASIKSYPRLHYYVSVDIPQVANVRAIMSQIKRLAGKTPSATIKWGLKWGNDPLIKIVAGLTCAGIRAYGCHRIGSNEISLDEQMVKDFEAGKGMYKTAHGKQVFLVGVTLLHELTHWADAQDGVDDPVPHDPLNEEGNAYEKGVYGKIMP